MRALLAEALDVLQGLGGDPEVAEADGWGVWRPQVWGAHHQQRQHQGGHQRQPAAMETRQERIYVTVERIYVT